MYNQIKVNEPAIKAIFASIKMVDRLEKPVNYDFKQPIQAEKHKP